MVNPGQFQQARTIDDAWGAVDPRPLRPGDPRYVDCSSVRSNALKKIKTTLQFHTRAGRDLHLLNLIGIKALKWNSDVGEGVAG